MKLTDKKAIFFDLDGTLIDSVPDLALAVNEMLAALGKETFDESVIRYWVGNGAQTLVKRALLGKRDVDNAAVKTALFEKALDIFLQAYRSHLCDATRPYPHVPETIKELSQRGCRLAIITNKPEPFIVPILEGLGLKHYFEAWLGGDSLPTKKPDPQPLLHMCETFNITVEDAVMVGDSKNDILAANACGMASVGVTYGYNYGEDIAVHQPTVVIEKFEALLNIL